MRFIASSHRVDQLAYRTKWLVLLVMVLFTLQLVSGVLMHHRGPGWTLTSITRYYAGDQANDHAGDAAAPDHSVEPTPVDEPSAPDDPFGGFGGDPMSPPGPTAPTAPAPPMIDEPARSIAVPRAFGTLLEIAHFHLVMMPLVVFVVAHVFAMCPWGRGRFGGAVAYLTFAGVFLDILSPFAVRYGGGGFAIAKLLGFGLLAGGLAIMLLSSIAALLWLLVMPKPESPRA